MFRKRVRCFNCGLDYKGVKPSVCPRCGDVRTMKRSVPFNDNAGSIWKSAIGSGTMAAGDAARELRRQGSEDPFRRDRP